MELWHASPRRNRDSILAIGLSSSFALGGLKVVWFHTRKLREWAVLHVCVRHGLCSSAVDVYRLRVSRTLLLRGWAEGIWRSKQNAILDPSAIVLVSDAASILPLIGHSPNGRGS